LFFISEIGDFQKIVGTFIEVVDNVSKEVEKEKMKVCLKQIYVTLKCSVILDNQSLHLTYDRKNNQ